MSKKIGQLGKCLLYNSNDLSLIPPIPRFWYKKRTNSREFSPDFLHVAQWHDCARTCTCGRAHTHTHTHTYTLTHTHSHTHTHTLTHEKEEEEEEEEE